MISLREELDKLIVSQADENGAVHVMRTDFLDDVMTIIEDRATKAYSDFIG